MNGWKPTILVVDDQEANVRLLEVLLEGSGYDDVRSTTDPTRVESLLYEIDPDIVLLDLHMPGLDGYQVMELVSKLSLPDDYLPILVLTADDSNETKHRALQGGAKDFLSKPFDTAEVLARVANLLETRLLHLRLRQQNAKLESEVQKRTATLWDTVNQLAHSEEELRVAQEETITSLSLAAEYRDDETFKHIERMSRYCLVLADAMRMGDQGRDVIRLAAKMHDIGKIGISDAILMKPGQLSDEEYEIMKSHTLIGHEILRGSRSELARTAASIACAHHERIDGSGYPLGLEGDDIPLAGRIAAVADVFDALTSDRVYRKAFPLLDALEIMRNGRDTQFDANILDLFFDNIHRILEMKESLDGR